MFEELLIRLAESLHRRGLPYMIIGGQAVLLYGEPRLTRDIDITLGVDVDRFEEVASLTHELGLVPLPPDPLKFSRETMVLPTQEKTTGIRVDFIFSYSSYESQAIQRARQILMGQQKVSFASPEDVVVHKIIAGRPRDLEDIRTILLKYPPMDSRYIRQWLRELSSALDGEDFEKIYSELEEEVPKGV
ncbi:MAG: nucleotidyltransferase [Deltaproteobacteria bacterium]|nr:nucleotidyltransferase [Deltaproteobacteria bacterium]